MPKRTCSIEGCERLVHARNWCKLHLDRWYKHGSTEKPNRRPEWIAHRFWSKVNKNGPVPKHRPDLGPCWMWTSSLAWNDYGRFSTPDRLVQAHRWAWEQENGPVSEGKELDHLCLVKRCVRPSHMEAVTHRENVMRARHGPTAINARKTHCKHGHPFDETNTLVTAGSRNSGSDFQRVCRMCSKLRTRARRAGLPYP